MALGFGEHVTTLVFLTAEQLSSVFDTFREDEIVSVARIRYKNRQEIRTYEDYRVEQLRTFVELCLDEGHQPGGDLEVKVPALGMKLVGHHDGLYWLEANRSEEEST